MKTNNLFKTYIGGLLIYFGGFSINEIGWWSCLLVLTGWLLLYNWI